MTSSKGIHEMPTILLALSVIRVLEGHANDPQLTQKEAEILAVRGTIKVEGGYRFSRDTRLKEVCRKYCYNSNILTVFIVSLHCYIFQK